MIKKQVLLAISILSIIHVLTAQRITKPEVQWGSAINVSRKSTLSDIVGYDQSGFYAVKTEAKYIGMGIIGWWRILATLEHYNNDLNPDRLIELEPEKDEKKMSYERIVQMKNKLFFFTSYKDKKERLNELFVQEINKNTLKPAYDLNKVAEVDYEGNANWNAGNFNVLLSRDSSKMLAYCNLPYEKEENERFAFYVFNDDMKLLWQRQVEIPYEDELFEIKDYNVDNRGNVHVLGRVFNEKRKVRVKGEPNFRYEVISYFEGDRKPESYPVKLEGKFLNDMQITVDSEGHLVCAGFYSNEGTNSITGTYYLKINKDTKQVIKQSSKPFPIDFITQNLSERQEKRVEKRAEKGKSVELLEFDLDNLVIRSDGGIVLVGEQYFMRAVTTQVPNGNGGFTTTTTYYYHYNDIVVVSISPGGDIEWSQKLPKLQMSVNDGGHFSSYSLSVIEDKMYFLFNDHPDNIGNIDNYSDMHAYRGGKKSMVVVAVIDSEGNYAKTSLFDTRDGEVIIRPKVSEQISKRELVLFGQKGKKHQFAKLTFPE